ncbi:PREDICTED: uncharacterized protein LOC107357370 isoform X1 [Acropora digitifera]|uniref:uncharacterized protein LOC107357370 isoform X1 n=1 Tax=Acropora digitifera TaxID=70779 RepID=UPI000779F33A|nr:PREDICTED: uncharacterized protein LOC107357370 isoform X1 [Acropora digitifera]
MVKSQITLMEGEVLNNENKRNAFLWLQSYIEQLGVRTKKTGTCHGSQGLEQGLMVISNSANHKTAVSSNESKADQAAQSTSDDAPGLAEFCQFVSGTPVPPQQPIRVQFSTDDNQTLPVAETCFMWLVLPVTSSCFQEFKKNIDIALKFEETGFYIM